MMEIDHDQREVFLETMQLQIDPPDIHGMQPSSESVAARLTSPVVTTYLDTEKIAFERWVVERVKWPTRALYSWFVISVPHNCGGHRALLWSVHTSQILSVQLLPNNMIDLSQKFHRWWVNMCRSSFKKECFLLIFLTELWAIILSCFKCYVVRTLACIKQV